MGLVHVMTEKGQSYDGFPMDLKSGSVKSYAIQKGKGLDKR